MAVPARAPGGAGAGPAAWGTDGPGRPAVGLRLGHPRAGGPGRRPDRPVVGLVRRGRRPPGAPEPNAMSVATVADDGGPDARLVLARGVDRRGFAFFTNLARPRPASWRRVPWAAATFVWLELHRQVRLRGSVEPVAAGEADAYYASRPRSSRIGAWASPQSQRAGRPGGARGRGRRGRGPLPRRRGPPPPLLGRPAHRSRRRSSSGRAGRAASTTASATAASRRRRLVDRAPRALSRPGRPLVGSGRPGGRGGHERVDQRPGCGG